VTRSVTFFYGAQHCHRLLQILPSGSVKFKIEKKKWWNSEECKPKLSSEKSGRRDSCNSWKGGSGKEKR